MAPHRWPLQLNRVSECLADAEVEKAGVAERRCAQANWAYLGAAFSPWGACGPNGKKLLFELSKKATVAFQGAEQRRQASALVQGISLALDRQHARMLALRYRVQEGSGIVLPDEGDAFADPMR